MLPCRFKAGNSALSRAHPLGHGVPSKASPRACLQHSTCHLIFECERFVRFGEALPRLRFGEKRLVVVGNGLIFSARRFDRESAYLAITQSELRSNRATGLGRKIDLMHTVARLKYPTSGIYKSKAERTV